MVCVYLLAIVFLIRWSVFKTDSERNYPPQLSTQRTVAAVVGDISLLGTVPTTSRRETEDIGNFNYGQIEDSFPKLRVCFQRLFVGFLSAKVPPRCVTPRSMTVPAQTLGMTVEKLRN